MKPLNQDVVKLKPSGIRRFFDLANTMQGVISLGVGEPDFDTPWHICEKAMESLYDGKTHYTANRGNLDLRQAIAHFHAQHYQQHYDPETDICVTVGGSEAIDITMRALLNPGDEVIVCDPCYVAYEPAITLAQAKMVPIHLTHENGFKLTKQALEKAITSKTKALMINFPSNPTGGVMEYEDYATLVDVIKKHELYVVSDEIYAELVFEGQFASLAQFPEIKDQVIVINGMSKAFAMTGWRLGYILSSGVVSEAITKIHQYVIMAAPTIAQIAAKEALLNGYEHVIDMRESYRQRRNLLVARLNRMGLSTAMPKGTFYVFANIASSGLTSEQFCEQLLQKQKVACVPGTAFGPSGEGFMRISYAYSLDHIKKACDRLEAFMKELNQS